MSFLAAFAFFCAAAGIVVAVAIYDAYDAIRWARQSAKSRELMRRKIEKRRREMGMM